MKRSHSVLNYNNLMDINRKKNKNRLILNLKSRSINSFSQRNKSATHSGKICIKNFLEKKDFFFF